MEAVAASYPFLSRILMRTLRLYTSVNHDLFPPSKVELPTSAMITAWARVLDGGAVILKSSPVTGLNSYWGTSWPLATFHIGQNNTSRTTGRKTGFIMQGREVQIMMP